MSDVVGVLAGGGAGQDLRGGDRDEAERLGLPWIEVDGSASAEDIAGQIESIWGWPPGEVGFSASFDR